MRRIAAFTLALALTGATGSNAPSQLSAQAGSGWTTLFDGKTLTGWNVLGDANWSVANGEIQANKGSGHLVTPMSYGDFQMTVDIWVDKIANSGVFIRMSDPKTVSATNSYEVNIFDTRPDPAYRTGAIVNVAKPLAMINAADKWNTLDITARGSKMTIVLNGVTTVKDAEDAKFPRGPIALQYGAGIVKFKNVRIRTL
jgi:hypothetical protein